MMGYNSAEGIVTSYQALKKMDMYDKDLGQMIPKSLNVPNESPNGLKSKELAELIRQFYFDGQNLSKVAISKMVDLQTDYHFGILAHMYAEIHCRKQPK